MAATLFRHEHHMVNDNAGGALSSGDIVVMADGRLGVVTGLSAVASGDPVSYAVNGQHDIPSASATTFAKGALVYFDTVTLLAVTAPNSNTKYAGVCTKAKVNGDLYVLTDLNVSGPANNLVGFTGGLAKAGLKVAVGQSTTVAASDTIVTGLALVIAVVASLDADPSDDPEWVTASIGDQAGTPAAGSFLLKTWKNTGGTDPTPVAATTFTKKVNWIAIGT